LEWAEKEIVGFSPIALYLADIKLAIEIAIDNGTWREQKDLIQELEDGLTKMRKQRRYQQSRLMNGHILSLNPAHIDMINWLDKSDSSIPASLQVLSKSLLTEGENYGKDI
jgi:hypothetical protein